MAVAGGIAVLSLSPRCQLRGVVSRVLGRNFVGAGAPLRGSSCRSMGWAVLGVYPLTGSLERCSGFETWGHWTAGPLSGYWLVCEVRAPGPCTGLRCGLEIVAWMKYSPVEQGMSRGSFGRAAGRQSLRPAPSGGRVAAECTGTAASVIEVPAFPAYLASPLGCLGVASQPSGWRRGPAGRMSAIEEGSG